MSEQKSYRVILREARSAVFVGPRIEELSDFVGLCDKADDAAALALERKRTSGGGR